jgi:hypothetical protein
MKSKVEIKEYNTEYYIKKKDHLTERILCDCGLEYSRYNKYAHVKGRIHQLYLKLTAPPPVEYLKEVEIKE